MSPSTRLVTILASAAVLAICFIVAFTKLPGFGNYPGPYGTLINAIAVGERRATNVPTVVMFDIRGFDTLFEEYILFASVTGLSLLLRHLRDQSGRPKLRGFPTQSHAVTFLGRGLMAATMLLGLYVLIHGNLTPGGGFHGGVIFATGVLVLYLALGYRRFRRAVSKELFESLDSFGAAGYALVGFTTLASTGVFLENAIEVGSKGSLFSGGTIPIINVFAGIEVGAAFVLVVFEFLKETRRPKVEEQT